MTVYTNKELAARYVADRLRDADEPARIFEGVRYTAKKIRMCPVSIQKHYQEHGSLEELRFSKGLQRRLEHILEIPQETPFPCDHFDSVDVLPRSGIGKIGY